MTQVIPIPYSGIKRKRGGNMGLEREHWLCLHPKVISPKIWRSEAGLDRRRYYGKI